MPNQKDVAKLAGVSSASVSRYLADPENVGAVRGKRIQKAIDSLNYKVDTAAQALKTGKSHHISILIPGSAPFYWVIIQNIQQRLSEAGYYSSVLFTRQYDQEIPISNAMVHRMLHSNQIEAFIHFPLSSEKDRILTNYIRRMHDNLLVVDDIPEDDRIPYLLFDNYGAGKLAAKEFAAKGHKKILILTGDEFFRSSTDRTRGFLDGLREEGIEIHEDYILHASFTASVAFPLFINSVFPEFTAVLAPNDTTAIAFIRAAQMKGLRCPEDYQLISFDNNIEYAPYTTPSITSFNQPVHEAGIHAAELILDLIEHKDVARETLYPLKLVKRESFH